MTRGERWRTASFAEPDWTVSTALSGVVAEMAAGTANGWLSRDPAVSPGPGRLPARPSIWCTVELTVASTEPVCAGSVVTVLLAAVVAVLTLLTTRVASPTTAGPAGVAGRPGLGAGSPALGAAPLARGPGRVRPAHP